MSLSSTPWGWAPDFDVTAKQYGVTDSAHVFSSGVLGGRNVAMVAFISIFLCDSGVSTFIIVLFFWLSLLSSLLLGG